MTAAIPKSADLVSPFTLRIAWKDGAVTDLGARQLRLLCPCAMCIEEGTGKKLLDPNSVRPDILILGVELVGRYGLTFVWSDGHKTGIFTFALMGAGQSLYGPALPAFAREFGLSEHTVVTLSKRIYRRLGVRGRSERSARLKAA